MDCHIRVGARALIVENESVLLIEFSDETGLHYNLPGGGVDPGESLIEALKREAREEASVNIEVGRLAFVIEYEPKRNSYWAGSRHSLSLVFESRLCAGSTPKMPDEPDPNQTAVRWIPLSELETVELLPHVGDRIVGYCAGGNRYPILLEEPIKPEKIKRWLGKPG
jgi:8-oxo-dGTP pyrophosphatase MutT (NUDIX family)